MIRRFFLTQSHYFPVPPRLKPVKRPTESRSTRTGYGLTRWSPGRVTVVAGSAPVKAVNVPAWPRLSPVVPRLSSSESRQSPGIP
ncbi:hypothetical protein DPMN_023650 [Dreissena polymorpha]|uniref:Uncharacterized protein n=1 Tax=Dreissena polymorpha TaxID=45954 RepID=A0A9D4RA38_DREPO|nr:hypothetical protein DPMN_023650 [Dreissena polymorpha]